MATRQQDPAAPAIIGHRGARGLWPENTLEGFAGTIGLGIDGIELDVGLTRDGIAVVHHNPALNRDTTRDAQGRWLKKTPGGPAPLHTLDLAELQTYDVGGLRPRTAYGLRFTGQQVVTGARAPTLDDTLQQLFAAGVAVTIEVKSVPTSPSSVDEAETPPPADMAAVVVESLRAAQAVDEVLMTSFDWRVLSACRALEPSIDISCLTVESTTENTVGRIAATRGSAKARAEAPNWTDGMHLADFGGSVPRMVKGFGSTSWSPYVGNVDERSMADARAEGLRVFTWTVNKPRDMRRMIAMGVDGIITDYPDQLRKVYAEEGLPLPPPGREPGSRLQQEANR